MGQASRAGRREVEDGSRGRESGLSGRIIYEEGYAGETALLIRVPEKGLGGGNNRGESRRDSEVWGQEGEQERKGKGRKRKQAPQACRLEQEAARGSGTLRVGDLEATWEHRKGPCFGGFLSGGQPERAVPRLRAPGAGPEGKSGARESRAILRDAAPASHGPIVPRVQIVLFSL